MCHLGLRQFESAYKEIGAALRGDPSNAKFHKIAGFACAALAKALGSVAHARLAVDSFCAARELLPSPLNARNYMNARKLLFLLGEAAALQGRAQLLAYLARAQPGLRDAARFLRPCDGEARRAVPRQFQCAISLVG